MKNATRQLKMIGDANTAMIDKRDITPETEEVIQMKKDQKKIQKKGEENKNKENIQTQNHLDKAQTMMTTQIKE